MFIRTAIKTAAVALIIVAGTGAAFAKTAWVDEDTRVKEDHSKKSDTIAWADEGQKVNCTDFHNGYCYAERKGKDGWIDTDDLVFKKYKSDIEVDVCFGGGSWGGGGYGYGQICFEN